MILKKIHKNTKNYIIFIMSNANFLKINYWNLRKLSKQLKHIAMKIMTIV